MNAPEELRQNPPQPITEREARALTESIRGATERLWTLLLEAHERHAWRALGYASWESYVQQEFAMSRRHSYRLLDQGRVIRAIEEVTGVTHGSQITERAARDIKPVLPEVTEEIRSRIGQGQPADEATYQVIEARRIENSTQRDGADGLNGDWEGERSPPQPSTTSAASSKAEMQSAPAEDPRDAEIERLRRELAEALQAADDACTLAQDLTAIADGDAAKRMAQLEAELKAVKAVRDKLMRENAEIKREVKRLQRKLGM